MPLTTALCSFVLVALVGSPVAVTSKVLSIESFGAVPDSALGIVTPVFPEFAKESVRTVVDNVNDEFAGERGSDDNLGPRCRANTRAFNEALLSAQPGDTVQVPDGLSFHFTGGIQAYNLSDIAIDVAGSMHFVHDLAVWPFRNDSSHFGYVPAIHIFDSSNMTLTSSSQFRPTIVVDFDKDEVYMNQTSGSGGLVNGYGKIWWDEAILGRLPSKDSDTRPRLVHIQSSADMLVEKLTLVNSPFWTLTVEAVRAQVRFVNVLVDRKYQAELVMRVRRGSIPKQLIESASATARGLGGATAKFPFPNDIPDWVGRKIHQPEDLNTDGIDPIGTDIWIHDCIVQNADDSIAVKPPPAGNMTTALHRKYHYNCTRNVTVENMVLTGFGASIGSVGPTKYHACVDQVTFRNISMPGTGKGIYIKSDASDCHGGNSSQITNILYENVYMKHPFWWAIWIGPQQQHQPHTSLGGKCPLAYPLPGSKNCPTQGCTLFANITLRNIHIDDPFISPGVILGNETSPIRNLVFDNVTVSASSWKPWHGKWPFHESKYPFRGEFQCKNVVGTCTNSFPIPDCLQGM